MENKPNFVTGLDVGTENVRAVIGTIEDGKFAVYGYNEGKNAGMRKGIPANLNGPARSIDAMLGEAERMGDYDVRSAYVSINGSQILSTKTEGMIAVVATSEHEIDENDLDRVEDSAVTGSIPANRNVLAVIPLEYIIDGQGGIKDPLGMSGARLVMRANVISALTPNCDHLRKATEHAEVTATRLIPTAVAAGKAVLTEKQKENGVAVIDMGAATTSIAVYEEGDLQYTGVVPAGSNNITNDLAILLAIDPDMAEEIKTRFVTGDFDSDKSPVIKIGKEKGHERNFDRKEVDAVVKARLEEIFTEIRKKLKTAKYDQRLPEGVVLTGGGARMRDIELFAKKALEASVKIGVPLDLAGVKDAVERPEFAVAVGLAKMAAEDQAYAIKPAKPQKKSKKSSKKPSGSSPFGFVKKIFSKF